VADSGNNRIRKIATDGTITTFAGTGTAATAGDIGPATLANLYQPVALAFDGSGNMYVAERAGNVVRKISPTGTITTVAGTGKVGAPSSEIGAATSQPLNAPQGLSWDSSGGLLIADSGNGRIRRLTADGTITTVAGTSVSGGTGDGGPATLAALRFPYGVAVDGFGNFYIADTSNNKVRQVGADGVIATVAGNGTAAFTGDGSPATAYSLNAPNAVLAGPNCSILIADTGNQRIRRVYTAVDYTITTSPAGLKVSVDGPVSDTPAVIGILPNVQHTLSAPSPQAGPAGTQYVLSASKQLSTTCGAPRGTASLSFQTQYSLNATAGAGGTISSAAAWQNAGAAVTLTATPASGFVFTGWTGDCTGTGACSLVMNGPKQVTASFARAANVQAGDTRAGVGAGRRVRQTVPPSRGGIAR
jgi:uncharacterized repeat protein (TIGR02543 family)